ncbi:hypothetical protein QUF74_13260 [Candidatus Halobeggiatoa sp. HSG11]|nr:hypothetical protein [Candidatus Halobeggiatoa sp. HSG11]
MINIDLYLQDGSERPINRSLDNAIQKIFGSPPKSSDDSKKHVKSQIHKQV